VNDADVGMCSDPLPQLRIEHLPESSSRKNTNWAMIWICSTVVRIVLLYKALEVCAAGSFDKVSLKSEPQDAHQSGLARAKARHNATATLNQLITPLEAQQSFNTRCDHQKWHQDIWRKRGSNCGPTYLPYRITRSPTAKSRPARRSLSPWSSTSSPCLCQLNVKRIVQALGHAKGVACWFRTRAVEVVTFGRIEVLQVGGGFALLGKKVGVS
jgi:hypothetical protein